LVEDGILHNKETKAQGSYAGLNYKTEKEPVLAAGLGTASVST